MFCSYVLRLVKSFELKVQSVIELKKNIYNTGYRRNSTTMDYNDLSFNYKNIVLRDRV